MDYGDSALNPRCLGGLGAHGSYRHGRDVRATERARGRRGPAYEDRMEVIGHEAPSPDFDIGGPARAAEEIGNERMIIGTEDVCRRPLPRWVTWCGTWGTTILAGRAMRGPWQLVEPGSINCTVTVITP